MYVRAQVRVSCLTHEHAHRNPPHPLNTLDVQMCKCCQAIRPNVVHTVIVNMGSFGIQGQGIVELLLMNTVLLELYNFLFQLQTAMVILVVCHVGVLSRVVEVSVSLGPYIKFDCNLFVPSTASCRH